MILSYPTPQGLSGPTSDGNEGVLRILPSDGWMSYQDTLYAEFYPSAEMQSVYYTAPAEQYL